MTDKKNIDKNDLTQFILLVLYIGDKFEGNLYNVILSEIIYLTDSLYFKKNIKESLKYTYIKIDQSPKYIYEDQYLIIMEDLDLITYETNETGSYILTKKKLDDDAYSNTLLECLNKVIDFYNKSSLRRKDELIGKIVDKYSEEDRISRCSLQEMEGIV